MPWVCPMCSSNNSEDTDICFVCDSKRVSKKICTLTLTKVTKLKLSGDVVVPEEFNVIGEGAFKGRKDIYSITLHDDVRKISKEAFAGCTNLRKIICEDEIATVGIRAFADCTSLPVSQRVKAKYVADDAYYITPPPVKKQKIDPPKKLEEKVEKPKIPEKAEVAKKEEYRYIPKDTYIPDSSSAYKSKSDSGTSSLLLDWFIKYRDYIVGHKTLCAIVLVCAVVLAPVFYFLIRSLEIEGGNLYLTILGLLVLFNCFVSLYAAFLLCQRKLSWLFTRDALIVPISLVTAIAYALLVDYGKSFSVINNLIMMAVLGTEMYLYLEMTKKKEYEVFPILVLSTLISVVLGFTIAFNSF
ncbi:MAG: leucine-rich repeat protein [Clostridia bacterium]|nr:leucine-rich repeat protein [Clostridia bacterium]